MAQLVDQIRRIEKIKYQKEKYWKFGKKTKRKRISYMGTLKNNLDEKNMSDSEEVHLAELKVEPLYTSKLLQKDDKW